MKTFITILLGLFAIDASAAYPIEPVPLRKLIAESEYIVIGHVVAIEMVKGPDNSFHANTIARIRIREVLKGTIKDEVVEVRYNANFVCPAPPHYEANTDVVAFLHKAKGSWYTRALSYGVKTLSLADIDVYKARIIEMQEILAIQDSYRQLFETVEWLVKCAEHPATRWEGIYELSPESDFMSFYARSQFQPFRSMLSADQRERLKNALFDTAKTGYVDLGLIDLVYRGNEKEVHAFLLRELKKLPNDALFIASDYMVRIMQRKSNPTMERLVERFSEKRFETDDSGELRTIVHQFLALAEEK